MIPQNQTKPTDCLRACIASLLEFNIESVPDFTGYENLAEIQDGHPVWWLAMQSWLKEKGLFFLEVRIAGTFMAEVDMSDEERAETLMLGPGATKSVETEVVTCWNPIPYEAFCILAGRTKNGVRHMVVGKASGATFVKIHDPHQEQPGIASLEGVCFLLPLDPALVVRMGVSLEAVEVLASAPKVNQVIQGSIIRHCRQALNKPIIRGINGS